MLDLDLVIFGRFWLVTVSFTPETNVDEVGIMAVGLAALALLPCIGDMFGKLVCGGGLE